jgi:hypothetical protein
VSHIGYKNINLRRLDLIPPSRVSMNSILLGTLGGADLYPGQTGYTSTKTE